PEVFAQAPLKPLSPEQLARVLLQGTGDGNLPQAAPGPAPGKKPEGRKKEPKDFVGRIVRLFGGIPGKPSPKFEATPMQALFLSNDPLMMSLAEPRSGNLAERLQKMSPTDYRPIADELCISLWTRPADDQDVADVQEFLAASTPSERPKALSELIWAWVS